MLFNISTTNAFVLKTFLYILGKLIYYSLINFKQTLNMWLVWVKIFVNTKLNQFKTREKLFSVVSNESSFHWHTNCENVYILSQWMNDFLFASN